MKKTLPALVIAILFASTLHAQDKSANFGFRVSPGLSWFNPDMKGATSNGPVFRFGFGAMADIDLMSNIALSTGLGAGFNGGKLSYNNLAVPVNPDNDTSNVYPSFSTYKMRYVRIPLTFKGMTNQIGYMKYFIEFGGSINYNYRARLAIQNAATTANDIETEDIPVKKPVRDFRFSMVIRGGFEYNISGNTSLVVSGTFDNGLTNTFNPKKVETYEAEADGFPKYDGGKKVSGPDFNAITNSISIDVGVLF